ncbi:RNA polymerase sigma factor [Rhizobium sp. K1/93]|nr:RNA polymerase sigma factor [Rhizobium sp. L58/93]MBO9170744.1 RNA polymerase sigma factor [Rhizobium sp. L245/93]MBO9186567.1 RNA polymerase sigma factor [Rhizobium sp. E27B/91]QXZ87460.1 RNA polymerase sigma factor [Rhizobium sp. K1/93]QXZ93521.1 RNA polymerase sigma factor [Rhizobium sp. K15/93]QYA04834.1 RNA polymerase sigma factor [Rhizobium sp. B21/90]
MDSADHPDILGTFIDVRSRLANVIYRRVQCSATTADLLQDTFLRFWEKPNLLREVADLAGYFVTTGRNLALDHQRRKKLAPFVDGIEGLEAISDPGQSVEATAISRQELRRVQAALGRMPPRARQVFLLSRIDGLTYVEIGDRLGISPKTVFGHMVVALDRLRAELKAQG